MNVRMKKLFVDRKKVLRAADRAAKRPLFRWGAYVRSVSKRSIRKRDGTSKPGKPPHSHTGDLKRLIFFGFDPRTRSIIVGPELYASGNAAKIETGGRIRVKRKSKGQKRTVQKATIAERPFMQPAAKKANEKLLPDIWKNSVKR